MKYRFISLVCQALLVVPVCSFQLVQASEEEQLTVDIRRYFNNDGISAESDRAKANFDGIGWSYPAAQMPAEGRWRRLGIRFYFPGHQGLDNISCQGQRIELPNGDYRWLVMLAAAECGDRKATMQLIYESASSKVTVKVSDWCTGASFGELAAITSNFRHGPERRQSISCQIYLKAVPLDPQRRLTAIVLPEERHIHIFSLTVVRSNPLLPNVLLAERPELRRIIFKAQHVSALASSLGMTAEDFLRRSWNELEQGWDQHGWKGVAEKLAELEARLPQPQCDLTEWEYLLFGHSHIDMEWLWTITETKRVIKNTFQAVVDYMGRAPFHFVQSQAAAYWLCERHAPELFAQIERQIQNQRWHVVGGMWVEPDLNMPRGESLVRQILYGKLYFRDKFGVDVTVGWNPDSFGHSANLPQILRKGGIKYYYFCRCSPKEFGFWWEALDGSRVLVFRFPQWYSRTQLKPHQLLEELKRCRKEHGVTFCASCYGVGDHGGVPPFADVQRTLALNELKVFPQVRFADPAQFFRRFAKDARNIPVFKGEMNFTCRGCWTSHSNTKFNNRRCEHCLLAAEVLCTTAWALGTEYPQGEINKAWRNLLFNQFHDILPGSSIAPVYGRTALARYRRVLRAARVLRKKALNFLAAQTGVSKDSWAVLVFNPLSWPRGGWLRISVPEDFPHGNLSTPAGEIVSAVRKESYLEFICPQVPPLGYLTLLVTSQRASLPLMEVSGERISNGLVEVKIDPRTGGIAQATFPPGGRRLLSASGNVLHFLEDVGDAWTLKLTGRRMQPSDMVKITSLNWGPLRAGVQTEIKFKGSHLVRRIYLVSGSPLVWMQFECDWKNECADVMVKAAFPLALENPRARWEIPYGNLQRRCDGSEYPAISWVDVSEQNGSFGVALINNGRYGHSVNGAEVQLSLLRDYPGHPDPQPESKDEGHHVLTYALVPHEGDWLKGQVQRRAWELNSPLEAVAFRGEGGRLPLRKSFIELIGLRSVIITALKKAERTNGYIIRLFEYSGREAHGRLLARLPCTGAWLVSLLEDKQKQLRLCRLDGSEEAAVELALKPYEIVSILLEKCR
jgi:alpha-mannosidase